MVEAVMLWLWHQVMAHPFPAALVVLQLGAVAWYACEPHWGRVVYWFAGTLITGAATWGMK